MSEEVTVVALDADGNPVSMNLWHRLTTTVRARYERSALAQYGAGLHLDCDDCASPPVDVEVPAPRRSTATRGDSATNGQPAQVS